MVYLLMYQILIIGAEAHTPYPYVTAPTPRYVKMENSCFLFFTCSL